MLVSHRCSTSISVVRLAYQYAIVKRAASKMNGNGYEKNGENNPAGRIFLVTVGSTIQWKIVTSTVQVSNCSHLGNRELEATNLNELMQLDKAENNARCRSG
jgi:hypothetical protein